MSWSWNDVYPGKRMVRLILDEDQIALLSQLRGVHAVGPDTFKLAEDAVIAVRGGGKEPPQKDLRRRVPKPVASDPPPPRSKVSKAPSKPVRNAVKPPSKPTKKAAAKTPSPKVNRPQQVTSTQEAMTNLVAGAVKQVRRTIRDEALPVTREPARPPSAITKADLALVEKAIASGEVTITVCPPMTFTPDEEVGGGWKPPPNQRAKRIKAKREIARQRAGQQAAKGG